MDAVSGAPPSMRLRYGTSGFRAHASLLRTALERCGMLAALRSRSLRGASVGVMVTASHNAACDNGVKLVEPDGSMLDAQWEPLAESLVNADADALPAALRRAEHVAEQTRTSLPAESAADDTACKEAPSAMVVTGRDTRASGEMLEALAARGAVAFGAHVRSLGVVSTPELHWTVRELHQRCTKKAQLEAALGRLNYADALAAALVAALPHDGAHRQIAERLGVDGANGVGAVAMESVFDACARRLGGQRGPLVFNAGEGELNLHCGADYVHNRRLPPANQPAAEAPLPSRGRRFASLDGDADRAVYYAPEEGAACASVLVADGDAICALVVRHIVEQLRRAGAPSPSGDDPPLSLGVAHTAYSNGAFVEWLHSLRDSPPPARVAAVHVHCTRTGVKHLERAARRHDIGVYWEPNGHGTVLLRRGVAPRLPAALRTLLALPNAAVGDGVANVLLVEAILAREGAEDAAEPPPPPAANAAAAALDAGFRRLTSVFVPRRSRLAVVKVGDRRRLVGDADDEQRVREPPWLQSRVDDAVRAAALTPRRAHHFPAGQKPPPRAARAFVRASGTEEVVRVYAEMELDGDEQEDGDGHSALQRLVERLCVLAKDTCTEPEGRDRRDVTARTSARREPASNAAT